MDVYDILCCGCLCTGRKMHLIDEFTKKQCFLQIISEIPLSHPDNIPLWLCWECNARIHNFYKFKQRIKRCYKKVNDYGKQHLDLLEIMEEPILQSKCVCNINILNKNITDTLNNGEVEIYKTETYQEETSIVKTETSDITTAVSNENDENFLREKETNSEPIKTKSKDRKKRIENSSEVKQIDIEYDTERKFHFDLPDDSEPVNSIDRETNKIDLNTIVDLKGELEIKDEEINDSVSDDYNNEDIEDIKIEPVKKAKGTKHKVKSKHKKIKKSSQDIFKEIILTIDEIEEERLNIRNSEEYINAIYKCDACILPFPNGDDLKDHLALKHQPASKLMCNICERTFQNDMTYSYHTNKHTKRFECNVCQQRFATKNKVTKHHSGYHGNGVTLACDVCLCEFATEDSLQKHKASHGPSSPKPSTAIYPCPHCHKSFKWKSSLRKHLETHQIQRGDAREPYCDTCGLSFATTSNLQKHVKTSSKHQMKLKLRNPATPAAKDLSNTSLGQFVCAHCGLRYQWRGNLHRHVRTHLAKAKGELHCEPCKRTFSSIATYKQHLMISKKHVSENDFKYTCDECGKKFVMKSKLRDHINWEHLKKYTHACDVCQKVFKSNASLYLHKQVVHNKDNALHLCHHCGKAFPSGASLRSHVSSRHTTNRSQYNRIEARSR